MNIIGDIPFVDVDRPSVAGQAQLVEAFRLLRRTLRAQLPAGVPITCTVTSPVPGAGKSFVAANLSLNFSEAGFRTLLVDGDKRGSGARSFGIPTAPVRSSDGAAGPRVDAYLHKTSYERLVILTGENVRALMADAGSDGQVPLMDELRARFDVVIVDGPWWGTDAAIDRIVRQTDGHLIVRRAAGVPSAGVAHAAAQSPAPPILYLGDVVISVG